VLGEVQTFQRGDLGRHGMFFKIVPKYSYKKHKNHRHYKGCWKRYGSKSRKAKAQSILPCNSAWPFKSKLEDFKVNVLQFKVTVSTVLFPLTILRLDMLVGWQQLRQVKAWVERLKRPPTENAKILYNDTEGSK